MPRREDKVTSKIRRTAGEVKRYRTIMRVTPIVVVILIILLMLGYVISMLYDEYGSFTVSVKKMDRVQYSLTLCETPDFKNQTGRLNCKATQEITNIDGASLPADLDRVNGSHNGENYVAYTFYCKNSGTETVTYEYQAVISNATLNIEKAIRVRLYVNGVATDYARTRSDGTGPEEGTVEFYTDRIIARDEFRNFAPGSVTKYTVVIWLEGNDSDCVDNILGGQFKIEMIMSIKELNETQNGG